LAFSQSPIKYFVVAPGTDQLCLAVRNGPATVSTCRSRSTLTPSDVIWISHAEPGGVYDLYGLVPDSVTTVAAGSRFATATNNVFLLRAVPASVKDIVLTSADGAHVVSIGEQVPQNVTIAPDPE
jgi:hypothetical protein